MTREEVEFDVDVLVVGAGVSGSTLAFHLFKNHKVDSILLTDCNPFVGGNVISKRKDGFLWEEGPSSFHPTADVMKTVYELGLENELVLSDDNLPYFVYWVGEKTTNLHALPKSFPSFIFNFDLLTWSGKIRAGLGALGFVSRVPIDHEESIREFTTRHLGEEAFLRLIDPFVSGVYTGDPDALSMKAALKNIHKLEGKGYIGPGILLGALHNLKNFKKRRETTPLTLCGQRTRRANREVSAKACKRFPTLLHIDCKNM